MPGGVIRHPPVPIPPSAPMGLLLGCSRPGKGWGGNDTVTVRRAQGSWR